MMGVAVGRWGREGLPLSSSQATPRQDSDTQEEHRALLSSEDERQVPLSSRESAVEDWEQVCVLDRRRMWTVSAPVHDSLELHLKMVGARHP